MGHDHSLCNWAYTMIEMYRLTRKPVLPVRLAAIMRCAGQCYIIIMVLVVTVLIALAAKGRKKSQQRTSAS